MNAEQRRKSVAHRAVQQARKDGARFPRRGRCEACDRQGPIIWHHWSYDVEHHLDVIPLCRRCHSRVHSGGIPEPRTGRLYPKPKRVGGPAWVDPFTAQVAVLSALWDGKGYAPFMRKDAFAEHHGALIELGATAWLEAEGRSMERWRAMLCALWPERFDFLTT